MHFHEHKPQESVHNQVTNVTFLSLWSITYTDAYICQYRNHINELIFESNTLTDSRFESATENICLVSPYICPTIDVRKTMSYSPSGIMVPSRHDNEPFSHTQTAL